MTTIVLRQDNPAGLSIAQIDANFTNLNTDKVEVTDAVSTNTASKVVRRDSSGNFSANVITADLTGKATSIAGGSAGTILYQSESGVTAKLTVGESGQILQCNGAAAPSWVTLNALPSQSGNNGKYLTTDGSTASWATVADASITVNDDTSTDTSYYPTMSSITSGQQSSAKVSSTKLYFNPSTGTLNSTTFNSLSDINVKSDISQIRNSVQTINKIDGVEFKFKDSDKKSAGVIAQQLEQILPDLVDTSIDGLKSVNYSGLIGYLIEAIKEHQYEIDALNERVKALENK